MMHSFRANLNFLCLLQKNELQECLKDLRYYQFKTPLQKFDSLGQRKVFTIVYGTSGAFHVLLPGIMYCFQTLCHHQCVFLFQIHLRSLPHSLEGIEIEARMVVTGAGMGDRQTERGWSEYNFRLKS